MAGLVLCLNTSWAGSVASLSSLRSFGLASNAAANPCAELTVGTNGVLYGTTSAGGSAGQGTIFEVNTDGTGFASLKSFGTGTNDGAVPVAGLIQASDGLLYGATSFGGAAGYRTVFRLGADGRDFTILRSFTNNDGAYPEGRLLEASDGWLYGTTSGGGTNDFGTIFRLGKDGSGFLPLVFFSGTNGANPEGGLIEASDGALYGTTYSGGATTNGGTVFTLNKDGTGFAVLKNFTNNAGSPTTYESAPYGRLVEGTNGMLYGTTSMGSSNWFGNVYCLNKDGTGYKTLRLGFGANINDGRIPVCELILGSDNLLYGTTYDGGTNGNGSVFRIGQDGSNYVELYGLSLAKGPAAALVQAPDGTLYGTTQLGGDSGAGAVFRLQTNGSGFAVIKSFEATGGDGQSSYGRLTLASDGALYGTTRLGGSQGSGSIFSILFDGLGYRIVSSLNPSNSGASPVSAVLEATNGVLYAGTQFGGIGGNNSALISVNKDGSDLNLLYDFTNADQEIRGALIQGKDGALYGTIASGSYGPVVIPMGVLFRINLDGSGYTNIERFSLYVPAGANPVEALTQGKDGALYATTYDGGTDTNGLIFKINIDGTGYTILRSFGGSPDGAYPMSPLMQGSDGLLYGTTHSGGTTNSAGTVFSLSTNGTSFALLHSFIGVAGDARLPCGDLVEGSDGALYGTSERGGVSDQGALFTLHKDGRGYAVLASFGAATGEYPRGGLIIGPDGALYGTTDQGGAMGFGTIFRYGAPIEGISAIQFQGSYASLICAGLPGTNYFIERTSQLGPVASWSVIATTNAPANGQFSVPDQNPPPTAAFYRLSR